MCCDVAFTPQTELASNSVAENSSSIGTVLFATALSGLQSEVRKLEVADAYPTIDLEFQGLSVEMCKEVDNKLKRSRRSTINEANILGQLLSGSQ